MSTQKRVKPAPLPQNVPKGGNSKPKPPPPPPPRIKKQANVKPLPKKKLSKRKRKKRPKKKTLEKIDEEIQKKRTELIKQAAEKEKNKEKVANPVHVHKKGVRKSAPMDAKKKLTPEQHQQKHKQNMQHVFAQLKEGKANLKPTKKKLTQEQHQEKHKQNMQSVFAQIREGKAKLKPLKKKAEKGKQLPLPPPGTVKKTLSTLMDAKKKLTQDQHREQHKQNMQQVFAQIRQGGVKLKPTKKKPGKKKPPLSPPVTLKKTESTPNLNRKKKQGVNKGTDRGEPAPPQRSVSTGNIGLKKKKHKLVSLKSLKNFGKWLMKKGKNDKKQHKAYEEFLNEYGIYDDYNDYDYDAGDDFDNDYVYDDGDDYDNDEYGQQAGYYDNYDNYGYGVDYDSYEGLQGQDAYVGLVGNDVDSDYELMWFLPPMFVGLCLLWVVICCICVGIGGIIGYNICNAGNRTSDAGGYKKVGTHENDDDDHVDEDKSNMDQGGLLQIQVLCPSLVYLLIHYN